MAAQFEKNLISPDIPIKFRKKSPNFKELSQSLLKVLTKIFGGGGALWPPQPVLTMLAEHAIISLLFSAFSF